MKTKRTPPKRSPPPALARIARAALALWAWAIALNIRIHPAAAGLDQSGAFMFNYAHLRGFVFGRDVAFTYGPLSFLTLPMPLGRNLELGFLFQFLIWLLFVAVTAWFIFARRTPLAAVLIFAAGLFFARGVFREFGFAGPDMFLVYLGLLLLGAALAGFGCAAALCTLLFFIKFSSAATLGGAMALYTAALFLQDPRKARRATLILGAIPAAIFLAHVIFYGSPDGLWRYIRVAMEMSAGYGVTMGEGGDTRGLAIAILLIAAWVLATGVLYWRGAASWSLAFACLGPLVLEFKHSFAREAGHIEIFFLFVPLLAGLVALVTQIRRKDHWYVAAALAIPAAIWCVREPTRVRSLAHPLASFANLHALQDLADLPGLRRRVEQASTAGLAPDRLPPELLARMGRAPVAIFPFECAYGGANPIDMRPFPIFQAYQAYTPYLDQWNAAFLEDPRTAPPYILFDWDIVDDRHPLLDVPATTLSLYRHYDFDSQYGGHTLLRRRPAPRFGALRLIDTREASLAQPLRLPASDHPLTARVHLVWNPTGRLLKFLFRLPEVRLIASTSAGRALNARVPPEVMEDGVPNFLPLDTNGARALFASEPAAGRLDALSFGGPGMRYLQPTARVEIYEAPDAAVPLARPALDFSRLVHLGTLDSSRIELLNDTGASAFSQITVPDTRGYVSILGWAVVDGGAAGGVVLELDGKPYPAEYGRPRPDIGALFHAGGPLPCGFEWSVPVWDLGKSWHQLALKILARDGRGYYDGGHKLRFKME